MLIPAQIPEEKKELFRENFNAITRGSNRFFMFAADQKIEHLNDDFHGEDIHKDAANPEHLFRIAQQGNIGAFATQLGLIERYGVQYPSIDYIVKLNSKTNIVKEQRTSWLYAHLASKCSNQDPISAQLWTVQDAMMLKKTAGLAIRGVGYTIYLGSAYEQIMLKEAAQIIHHAHQEGLVAILWIYPRGICVENDTTVELLAGAAGVANALGADIVKLKPPHETEASSIAEQLRMIKQAAGNTLVITSGGQQIKRELLLERIHAQLHEGKIDGAAIGRNIFQHSLPDAIKLTQAISALVYDNSSINEAKKML